MLCECCGLEKDKNDFSNEVCEDCCNSLILGQPYKVNAFYIYDDLQKQLNEANGI